MIVALAPILMMMTGKESNGFRPQVMVNTRLQSKVAAWGINCDQRKRCGEGRGQTHG